MLDHICTDHQIGGSRPWNREVTGFPVLVGVSILELRDVLRQFQASGLVISEEVNQLVARSAADVENLPELMALHQLESVKVNLPLPFIGEFCIIVMSIGRSRSVRPGDAVSILQGATSVSEHDSWDTRLILFRFIFSVSVHEASHDRNCDERSPADSISMQKAVYL